MEHTLSELRRSGSSCGGALVFWLKDLWLGAGWGVLDARSRPKSAYYALRRAFAPLALLCTDEGMNGPELHVIHDGPSTLALTFTWRSTAPCGRWCGIRVTDRGSGRHHAVRGRRCSSVRDPWLRVPLLPRQQMLVCAPYST